MCCPGRGGLNGHPPQIGSGEALSMDSFILATGERKLFSGRVENKTGGITLKNNLSIDGGKNG
jgi:hypothetical protein